MSEQLDLTTLNKHELGMMPVILAKNLENCVIRETNEKTATVIYATHIPLGKVGFKEVLFQCEKCKTLEWYPLRNS